MASSVHNSKRVFSTGKQNKASNTREPTKRSTQQKTTAETLCGLNETRPHAMTVLQEWVCNLKLPSQTVRFNAQMLRLEREPRTRASLTHLSHPMWTSHTHLSRISHLKCEPRTRASGHLSEDSCTSGLTYHCAMHAVTPHALLACRIAGADAAETLQAPVASESQAGGRHGQRTVFERRRRRNPGVGSARLMKWASKGQAA